MKKTLLGLFAAGAMSAQSVGGPVLGYVVDGESRLHPLFGVPAAARVGAAVRDAVKDTWGDLALLADGTALRAGQPLDGRWSELQPGAFLDATGREVLVAASRGAAWRLTLPARALSVRVSASGDRVLALLADESLTAWSSSGKAEYRIAASQWWSFAFAGERALAYDPAAKSLNWIDDQGNLTPERQLSLDGRYDLAVDSTSRFAVLLGEKAVVVSLGATDVRELSAPEGSERLEAVQGGRAFLLTRNPGRPLWILDPEREDALLVVPALPSQSENGGQQ